MKSRIKQCVAPRVGRNSADTRSAAKLQTLLLTLILGAAFLFNSAIAQQVKDPTTGEMINAPKYGGTFTYAFKLFAANTDPTLRGHYAGWLISGVNEKLGIGNWGTPRSEWGFKNYFIPIDYLKGDLVESWEQPDLKTIIFHVRKGVHWHNKAPMNGREFTADDVVWNIKYYAGIEGNKMPERKYQVDKLKYESVTATDKYTATVKLKEANLGALKEMLTQVNFWMIAPDVVKEHGNYSNWQNVVGTGPFELTDFVENSSYAHKKNPNYWGHDEKWPENQLPYVDELKAIYMPEEATRLSALRSGKIDFIHNVGGAVEVAKVRIAEQLQKTNPDIQVHNYFIRSLQSFGMNQRKPPFDDIRVRRAMQMALDLERIDKTYYKGFSRWTPRGNLGEAVAGFSIPFEQWPKDLQEEYTYNPEKAKQLLAEAGYPDGLKVSLDHRDVIDIGYVDIAVGFWKEIGVEVTVNVMDTGAWVDRRKKGLYELTTGDMAFDLSPMAMPSWWTPDNQAKEYLCGCSEGSVEFTTISALAKAVLESKTIEEFQENSKALDMYPVTRHSQIWGPKAPLFTAFRARVKGMNGEVQLGDMDFRQVISRLWIDEE